jgi:NhaA family Na+:H+ antiporter
MKEDGIKKFIKEFIGNEYAPGIILIVCTVFSMVFANSPLGAAYQEFWHRKIGFAAGNVFLRLSIGHWINDGLMTFFFLLVALDIRRELFVGELSTAKKAFLPVFAAIGGMAFPALIHFLFNHGTVTQPGIGIPIATDIAFVIGAMALLGSRVPSSLKVFLTALAIIDDLGSIIVIALFYAHHFSLMYLLLALGIYSLLIILNRAGVRPLPFYLIPGAVMWYFMSRSGIHATMTGVLLAFVIPFAVGNAGSPSHRLQHILHIPVLFLIVPVFAVANTGIGLPRNLIGSLTGSNSVGVILGLLCGKPLGITLASLVTVRLGLASLPNGTMWKHIIGAGFLGGIGFTMSIFITMLAFEDPEIILTSKVSILFGSLVSGVTGYLLLRISEKKRPGRARNP